MGRCGQVRKGGECEFNYSMHAIVNSNAVHKRLLVLPRNIKWDVVSQVVKLAF